MFIILLNDTISYLLFIIDFNLGMIQLDFLDYVIPRGYHASRAV